jgi:hypothetical protein
MEHILKLVAAQSTATIGSVMRAWLCVMAALWPSVSLWTAAYGLAPFRHHLAASIVVGAPVAAVFSIPVMAVLAVIHIARKW